MDIDRDALMEQIMAAQEELARMGHAATESAWQDLDLTMTQFKVILLLAFNHAMTISEVADALHVGRPTASVLVDRLVHLGLTERQEDREDRRRMVVTLSERGQSLVEGLRRGSHDIWRGWLSHLSDRDLSSLAQGVCALAQVVATETRRDIPNNHLIRSLTRPA